MSSSNFSSTLISDYPASKSFFTAKKGGYDLRGMTEVISVGNKSYISEYIAPLSKYYYYLPIAQGMVNSFVKF